MCGLFGIAGKGINKDDTQVFNVLGFLSQLRGIDGTGVYVVNTSNPKLNKLVKVDEDYNYWGYYNDVICKKKDSIDFRNTLYDIWMGHTRAATMGKVNVDNTHPFELENLVGAHNGTLKLAKYMSKDTVDSLLMFRDISQRGIKEVLSELTDECAYAISMYDKQTHKLCFALNGKRSLHFAMNAERNVLYWASEKQMLTFALDREGVKYSMFTLNPGIWLTDQSKIFSHNPEIFDGIHLEEYWTPTKTTKTAEEYLWGWNVSEDYYDVPAVTTEKKDELGYGKVYRLNPKRTSCCGKIISLEEEKAMEEDKSDYGYYDKGHYFCFYCDKQPN